MKKSFKKYVLFFLIVFFVFSWNVKALDENIVDDYSIENNTTDNILVDDSDDNSTDDLTVSFEEEVSILSDDCVIENTEIVSVDEVANEEILIDESAVNNLSSDRNLGVNNQEITDASISYQTHVQSIGWQDYKEDGELSGTIGLGKRVEAIKIVLDSECDGSAEYRTYVQDIGWQDYKSNDELSGTTGLSKRIEAIQIRLTGVVADIYDVYYRVHVQKLGWLGWAMNDEKAGTVGYDYRMEAIEIKLLSKADSFIDDKESFYQHIISYQTHVQSIGWQDYKKDGELSGTIGLSKRIEAIRIVLNTDEYEGDIEYRTHVQSIGWQDYKESGELSGTTGLSKRIEALQIRLTGELADKYDIYYRVHVQKLGWLGWAKNDEMAGTSGYSYRLEAIEIKLLEKDVTFDLEGPAYYQDYIRYNSYVHNIGWQGYVADGTTSGTIGQRLGVEALKIYLSNPLYSGSVTYNSYISGFGWENELKSDGQVSGVINGKKNIEALKIALTDEMDENYDIYYRVHSQKLGWLGWAKNGEIAGSNGYNYRIEALEIKLVLKGTEGPYSEMDSFIYGSEGYCLIESLLGSNKVVEVYHAYMKDGSNVSLYDKNNSVAQIWNMKKLNNGYYLISSSINPNVYLTADDSNVFVHRYTGLDSQLWSISNVNGDSYLICSKLNAKYITIDGGNTNNKTNVILSSILGNDSQLFNFIKYEDDLVFNGIDVSSHQGYIDWEKLSGNINFAIIRLGYGRDLTDQDDATFIYNVSKCEEYNIPYGVYIYSYALDEAGARSEAEHVLRLLEATSDNFVLNVWFDMEDADGYKARHGMPSNQTLVNICDAFGSAVENAGYRVGIYASLSWLNNQLNDSKLDKYDKWVAQWNGPVTFNSARMSHTSYTGGYSFWQFCSDGIIDGVSGYVDMDLGYNIF